MDPRTDLGGSALGAGVVPGRYDVVANTPDGPKKVGKLVLTTEMEKELQEHGHCSPASSPADGPG